MRLVYLPVNQAWAFLFGDDLATAQIIQMRDHTRFFARRADAVTAASECGLQVARNGSITA